MAKKRLRRKKTGLSQDWLEYLVFPIFKPKDWSEEKEREIYFAHREEVLAQCGSVVFPTYIPGKRPYGFMKYETPFRGLAEEEELLQYLRANNLMFPGEEEEIERRKKEYDEFLRSIGAAGRPAATEKKD